MFDVSVAVGSRIVRVQLIAPRGGAEPRPCPACRQGSRRGLVPHSAPVSLTHLSNHDRHSKGQADRNTKGEAGDAEGLVCACRQSGQREDEKVQGEQAPRRPWRVGTAHPPTLSPLWARNACKATDDAYLEQRQARQHDYPCRTAAGQQPRGE
jgi:hypothetical protein